ncbi:winged helix-turn-helix domain-containing protein [Manganibacter manganicus]|uniref:OmpR/PhoB-type domain-containing protein n=1 Tax=Manganibacter manganicus TaxID=1873176 RepID=A0A1V8RP49_9HYPH|nr:winged helix-turn-helix domain-containing protein [Pseudaminobacter manganicus]OQM74914.1 hypothetical protein BFN67_04680 [Pseudaminobacter manganicus]
MTHFPAESLVHARFSGQIGIIVKTLAEAYPRAVSKGALFDALYASDPNGGPDDPNIVNVLLYRVRKQIAPFGWTIPLSRGGHGIQGLHRLVPLEGAGE